MTRLKLMQNFTVTPLLVFYLFGTMLLPISLRAKDAPLLRKPSDFAGLYFFYIYDWGTIIVSLITPLIWIVSNQQVTIQVFSFSVYCSDLFSNDHSRTTMVGWSCGYILYYYSTGLCHVLLVSIT